MARSPVGSGPRNCRRPAPSSEPCGSSHGRSLDRPLPDLAEQLEADFAQRGRAAIRTLREYDPASYIRLIAGVMLDGERTVPRTRARPSRRRT